MKVNGSDFKFAFRKISNADLRAVMLQFKPQASTTVELQSPARPNTSNTGFEFVHLTDNTNVPKKQRTVSIDTHNISFATPLLVSNISILSSGNITEGTEDTVKIGSNSPSSLFCVAKLSDITVDELLDNSNINRYLCVNGKVSGETSLSSKYYPISSSHAIKIDDYTLLIVYELVCFTETTLPDFKAYTIEANNVVYKNVTILDCGMTTYAAQAS